VTVQYEPLGVIDGITRFCNGEVDMVTTFAPLTDEQLATCAQNEVTPETFTLGAFAPVVVVGNGTEFADCLTTAETALIFGATGDTVVENWTGVRAAFADQPLTLFTPTGSNVLSDLLVRATAGAAPRADGETSDDPAYRAAAVANVVGGVTYMSYPEFLGLPAIEAERVRALPINNGTECVAPDNATLTDGSYALSRPILLLVRRSSIARQDVQSYLWTANSDASFSLISAAGLAGVAFDDLALRRDALQDLFPVVMQEVADAMIAPDATAEAAPPIDSTPEVGPEPAAEMTPEAESTPEASGG
jgi:ABC-type phosphate transport system substrate-binding protein